MAAAQTKAQRGLSAHLVVCGSGCLYLLSGLEGRLYTNQRILHSSSILQKAWRAHTHTHTHTHTKSFTTIPVLELIHGRNTEKGDLWNIHTAKYYTTVKKIAHVIE